MNIKFGAVTMEQLYRTAMANQGMVRARDNQTGQELEIVDVMEVGPYPPSKDEPPHVSFELADGSSSDLYETTFVDDGKLEAYLESFWAGNEHEAEPYNLNIERLDLIG